MVPTHAYGDDEVNFRFNQAHLAELSKCSVVPNSWVGHDPLRWVQNVISAREFDGLADELKQFCRMSIDEGRQGKLSRGDLFRICGESKISSEACFLAIMAWGGQKRDHGRRAWTARNNWRRLFDRLRSGEIDRYQSYAEFKKLRDIGQLPGIGPAYFTKLIFFAHPMHDGYIMDQWTSLSMNLLVEGGPIVALTVANRDNHRLRRDTVKDQNGPDVYERFCKGIEALAIMLGSKPHEAEERIFSIGARGRRKPGPWRQYVKDNRP